MKIKFKHGQKYSLEYIRSQFEREDYKLVSKNYKNCDHKLEYICPKGHRHKISWTKWRIGRRCFYCHGNIGPTIEVVRKYFEDEGYRLLTNRYINNRQKLEYICNENHRHFVTWNDFKDGGKRCPECYIVNSYGPGHPNWKGGIACEPYCEVWLDKEFKESIKARDNYECQNPYCNGKSKRLCVHHIDYVKKHCHPMNLITVCNSCNSKANYNREWHTAFYKKIIGRKYEV